MPSLHLIIPLIEMIRYAGNNSQHYQHPYTHPRKSHLMLNGYCLTVIV